LKAFPNDDEIIKAWENGLHLAQEKAIQLGMWHRPRQPRRDGDGAGEGTYSGGDDDDDDNGDNDDDFPDWLKRSWDTDETTLLGRMSSSEDVVVDGDGTPGDDGSEGNDDSDDQHDAPTVRVDVMDQLQRLAEDEETPADEPRDTQTKTVRTVKLPDGKVIYKTTLVSQLNANPKLPLDRLQRVHAHNTQEVSPAGGWW
jgi:hypothetical protein